MIWNASKVALEDETYFETLNGLWKGKKPTFRRAGVIRNTNFTESGRIDYSEVAWLDVEERQLSTRQLQSGDIIVERSGGGPKQPVGRVVYFSREDGPFSFSNFTSAIRVRNRDIFDPKFVFYALLELYDSGNTGDIQRRTTGIRNLDFTAYKKRAKFPLIPIAEQQTIARVLGLAQGAIEQQELLLALSIEMKRALVHELFTCGPRREAQKETPIGLIPKTWSIERLGDLLSEEPKNGLYKHSSNYGDGAPILRIDDFSNDGDVVHSASNRVRVDEGERIAYALRKDDVVFNRVNSLSHLGKTALVGELIEPMIFESNMMRFRVDERTVLPRFVFRMLNSPICKRQIIASAKRAVAQSSINQGDLKALLLPVPPLEIQGQILEVIEIVVRRIEMGKTKKRLLTQLFRTLMHELMTAKIRLRVFDLPELEGTVAAA